MSRVPAMPPTSHLKLDRWAIEFTRQFTPEVWDGQPINVERLLDVVLMAPPFNIDVWIEPLPPGVEGITDPPNRLLISPEVYEALPYEARARFTGTHEAVHAVMHLPHLKDAYHSSSLPKLYRRDEIYTPRDPEWQANRGAAAILMPAPLVWDVIEEHGASPTAITERFGVSVTAARNRLSDALAGRMWAASPAARRLLFELGGG